MAFTNAWNNTTPADTDLADTYAGDLRNFRLDAQQRMAAMSGTFANAPTFEAGFAGVLYFATDTGQVLQWSGSAWTDVSYILGPRTFVIQGTPITRTGTAVQNLYTIAVPAGLMTTTTRVRLSMFYNTGGVSNVDTIVQIRSSATLVQGMAAPILSAPGEGMMLRFEGGNYGTLTLQNWMYVDLVHQSSGTITSTTIDTSVGAEFVTFYQGAGVGSAATYYGISVELM